MVTEIGSTEMILIYLAFAMGLANVCLLLRLLNSYWKTYNEIKSQFTIGLSFSIFSSYSKYFTYIRINGSINSSGITVCNIQ